MYELKKIGKALTSKSVGTGPSSYKKRIYQGRGLTEVEKLPQTMVVLVSVFSETLPRVPQRQMNMAVVLECTRGRK